MGIRAIDVHTGVKHGNPVDNQVEKSGHPPAILEVRMPGWPLNLYSACQPAARYIDLPYLHCGFLMVPDIFYNVFKSLFCLTV